MGNQFSTNNTNNTQEIPEPDETNNTLQPKSSYEIIDYIATYYILTADYISLTKLYDKLLIFIFK